MEMKETYKKLLLLQDILSDKFKVEEKIKELPLMLTSKIEVLNRLKKTFLSKHNQFKELEERIFEHQRLMGEISLRQSHLEEKSKNFKTQKEYEALDKEMNTSKQKEEEYRFQLLQDQRVIDDLRTSLEKDESSIQQQEDEIRVEQERINSEIDKLQDKLDGYNSKEAELMDLMDEDIEYKFERIVKNKDGIGIVTISNKIGHCNGCHFVLPPEFINNVRLNEKLQYCPNCSRILYFEEYMEDVYSIEDGLNEDDDAYFDID